jgi:predicted nucleic acid-binding protein
MGYTYIFRFDDGDLYKLGKANTLATRASALKTGNKDKLRLQDSVETEHPLAGEQFLKRLWKARKHRARSEIYRLTEAEVAAGMAELRHYLEHVLPVELAEREQVAELEEVDNTDTMIEASDDIRHAHRRLVEIEAEVRGLQGEAESLRRAIVLAIGKNRGITGIATFDKADTNRWINTEKLQAEHPDLYEQFLKPVFDKTAFGKKHRDLAEAFREPDKKRTFRLNEDFDA